MRSYSRCQEIDKTRDMEKIGSFEIVRYRFDLVNGEPKIIIEMVKVLDAEGKYIKFAKLKEVLPFLSQYPIKFKPMETT